MLSIDNINQIIKTINSVSNPEAVYLFGSYADGTATEDSDLDLLVIKNNIPDKMQELLRIKKSIISDEYSIDLLLYSEDEFEQKKSQGWKLFSEIEKKGKLINV
jgi:predicted nucleotidyltransferase